LWEKESQPKPTPQLINNIQEDDLRA
jgi:hypothetical protein